MNKLPSFIVIMLFAAFSFTASADMASVSVDIATSVTNIPPNPPNPADPPPLAQTEELTLAISLRNVSHEELKDLTVKYYIFAHTVGVKNLDLLAQGEKPASVPANGTVKVESDKTTAVYKPTYRQKNATGSTQVPPTGSHIAGYGARVFQGDKIVGEYFTSDSARDAATAGKPAAGSGKAAGK